MSIADFNNNDILENQWFYDRLCKQKEDELNPTQDNKNQW